jgi:hypothetical protein
VQTSEESGFYENNSTTSSGTLNSTFPQYEDNPIIPVNFQNVIENIIEAVEKDTPMNESDLCETKSTTSNEMPNTATRQSQKDDLKTSDEDSIMSTPIISPEGDSLLEPMHSVNEEEYQKYSSKDVNLYKIFNQQKKAILTPKAPELKKPLKRPASKDDIEEKNKKRRYVSISLNYIVKFNYVSTFRSVQKKNGVSTQEISAILSSLTLIDPDQQVYLPDTDDIDKVK